MRKEHNILLIVPLLLMFYLGSALARAQITPLMGSHYNSPITLKKSSPRYLKYLVVIDPGHGGIDNGASFGNIFEKNLNLDISLRLGNLLSRNNINVLYTRTNDRAVSLLQRAKIANDANADLFISIHNNYLPYYSGYSGTETLYAKSDYPRKSNITSKEFAQLVQSELVNELKTFNDGILYDPGISVLHHPNMPSVIAEVGYISNTSERIKLLNPAFRERAAQALEKAILKALKK